jgi:hypothetical protein
MKPITVFLVFGILFLQHVKAQDSLKSEQAKSHQASLVRITFSGTQSMRVPLMAIRDSSIFVYEKTSTHKDPWHKSNMYVESNWDSYNYRYIESIKVSNKKLRSWLLPVMIVGGAVAGAMIGYANAKRNGGFEDIGNVGAGIFLGGILGGGVGTLTGLLICNASDKKYMINGDWRSFEEMKKGMNY